MFGFGPAYAKLIRHDSARRMSTRRAEREVRMQQECGEELESLYSDWAQVFERLDHADGNHDGRIDRKALVKWVSALDLRKTIEFEANLNISPRELERLVSKADQNKDGFVDRCEFLELVSNRDKYLSRKQQSLLHQYLQIAAYAEEYSCWPPPIFIPCLSVLQIAIYIVHIVHFLNHEDHVRDQIRISWTGPEPICSKLIYDPSKRNEAWRFITYCLAHAGVQHIVFNMVMQLFVGLPLEASHGPIRVATVYFAGVLAGSLGTSTLDPHVFLAGASGGVYALIAAHLATLILNWQEDIVIMRRRFRSGKSTSAKHGHIVRIIRLITVLMYGIVDTGMAIYNRHVNKEANVKTSYIAHFSGALAGLLIGIIVLKNRKVEHWEKKLKVICVVIYLFLLILAVTWNIIGNTMTSITLGGNVTYFEDDVLYGPAKCHFLI